jgi:hypothetical protein
MNNATQMDIEEKSYRLKELAKLADELKIELEHLLEEIQS